MKVIITNTVAANGGDAAILIAIAGLLESAIDGQVEICVFDSNPQLVGRLYPQFRFRKLVGLPTVPRRGIRGKLLEAVHLLRTFIAVEALARSWKRLAKMVVQPETYDSLKDYQSCDIVVSTGGTYLVENYSLRARLFEFYVAHRFGKPLVLFTQSLGPFTRRRTRLLMRRVANAADAIYLRDLRSATHLQDLGASLANVKVVPDVVFCLADPAVLREAREGVIGKGPRVAVSVREWTHFKGDSAEGMERYLDAVAHLTQQLVSKYQARVVFLSTCQGVEGYRYDDSTVARQVTARLPDDIRESVTVDSEFHKPHDLRDQLSGFDLVVATRMHMAILSLIAGVPVFPIAYEFKTAELFEQLGLRDHVQMIDEITPASLLEGFRRFWIAIPVCRKRLFEQVLQLHLAAHAPGELFQLSQPHEPKSSRVELHKSEPA